MFAGVSDFAARYLQAALNTPPPGQGSPLVGPPLVPTSGTKEAVAKQIARDFKQNRRHVDTMIA
jgi:hypothetical protein